MNQRLLLLLLVLFISSKVFAGTPTEMQTLAQLQIEKIATVKGCIEKRSLVLQENFRRISNFVRNSPWEDRIVSAAFYGYLEYLSLLDLTAIQKDLTEEPFTATSDIAAVMSKKHLDRNIKYHRVIIEAAKSEKINLPEPLPCYREFAEWKLAIVKTDRYIGRDR